MFEQKSLNKIDGDYFNIIIADSQDVTIQSRNTGHYWYLHCSGNPTEEALVIFHKHRFKDGYHQHGHARSLRQIKQWERLRIAKQRRSLETACTMFSTNFGP